eukprot:3076289-Rhodomonas_salina.2
MGRMRPSESRGEQMPIRQRQEEPTLPSHDTQMMCCGGGLAEHELPPVPLQPHDAASAADSGREGCDADQTDTHILAEGARGNGTELGGGHPGQERSRHAGRPGLA